MSKESKSLRDRAARELRKSRNSGSKAAKAKSTKMAAGLKQLAQNQEWLDGERNRSPKRPSGE